MKIILFFILLFTLSLSFSQVSGQIYDDKRPIIKPIEFKVKGTKPGLMVFDISVDEKGNVISCRLDKVKTKGYSTPNMVKARNLITSHLKFEANSVYPKFHLGQVQVVIYK